MVMAVIVTIHEANCVVNARFAVVARLQLSPRWRGGGGVTSSHFDSYTDQITAAPFNRFLVTLTKASLYREQKVGDSY